MRVTLKAEADRSESVDSDDSVGRSVGRIQFTIQLRLKAVAAGIEHAAAAAATPTEQTGLTFGTTLRNRHSAGARAGFCHFPPGTSIPKATPVNILIPLPFGCKV